MQLYFGSTNFPDPKTVKTERILICSLTWPDSNNWHGKLPLPNQPLAGWLYNTCSPDTHVSHPRVPHFAATMIQALQTYVATGVSSKPSTLAPAETSWLCITSTDWHCHLSVICWITQILFNPELSFSPSSEEWSGNDKRAFLASMSWSEELYGGEKIGRLRLPLWNCILSLLYWTFCYTSSL